MNLRQYLPEELRLISLLRSRGMRLTPDRMLLFRVLRDADKPQTVAQLVEMVQGRGVNPATVYRTVEQFMALAVAQTILLSDGSLAYELQPPFVRHHHHFLCIQCGAIQDLPAEKVDDVLDVTLATLPVKPVAHKVDIYGYCQRCMPDDAAKV